MASISAGQMKSLIEDLWHWRVEDGSSWAFCAGILAQNYGYEKGLTAAQVETAFKTAFKKKYGYDIYVKCPECEDGEVIPRGGPYGKFASCSGFPNCKYKPPREKSG